MSDDEKQAFAVKGFEIGLNEIQIQAGIEIMEAILLQLFDEEL